MKLYSCAKQLLPAFRRPRTALRSLPASTPPVSTAVTTTQRSPPAINLVDSPPTPVSRTDEICSAIAAAASVSNPHADLERRYVRIRGSSTHATQMDMAYFLQLHDIPYREVIRKSGDIHFNTSEWIFDAGSASAAKRAAAKLTGRVCGLKLVNVTPVHAQQVGAMGFGRAGQQGDLWPSIQERGRAVYVSNLWNSNSAWYLWRFFGGYDVVDIRSLSRQNAAIVVFGTSDEAYRAWRERGRLPMGDTRRLIGIQVLE